jgi:hypothetical protein
VTQGRQTYRTSLPPDCGEFQIARVIIKPNEFNHKAGVPDHKSLVVSADVPHQAGEIEEQRYQHENDNADIAFLALDLPLPNK